MVPDRDAFAAGSLAVVYPLASPPVPGWSDGTHEGSRRYPWQLTMHGRGARLVPPSPLDPPAVTEPHIRAALTPRADGYRVWINAPGETMDRWWTPLPGDWDLFPGTRVSAVELLAFTEPQVAQFLVVHVVLHDDGLADPARVAAFFGRPTSARPDEGARRRLDHRVLGGLLRELGLTSGSYQPWHTPFVISHLVPEGDSARASLPPAELVEHVAAGWSTEAAWAARMAQSPDLDHVRAPALGPGTPDTGFWLGTTWVHPAAHGLALVSAQGLSARPTGGTEGVHGWMNTDGEQPGVQHVSLEALAHRNVVDLAILAIRQESYLREHADAVPRALNPRDHPTRLRAAHRGQRALLEFGNRHWVTAIASQPDASRVLAGLHAAKGLPDLYAEVRRRQQDLARLLVTEGQLEVATGDRRAPHTGSMEELADQLPRRTPEERRLSDFARLVVERVPECIEGWVVAHHGPGSNRRPLLATLRALDTATTSTDAGELHRLYKRLTRHPPGSDCRCAGPPVAVAAVAWNRRAPQDIVHHVLRHRGLLGDEVADDLLTAHTLTVHGTRLTSEQVRELFESGVPGIERPHTTSALMRRRRLDSATVTALWEHGRHGGPHGTWSAAVATLAAGIALNEYVTTELVALVAGQIWSGDASAQLSSVPAPFNDLPPREPEPDCTLGDLLLARLRVDSGSAAGLEAFIPQMAGDP